MGKPKDSLEIANKIAEKHNGKCLSVEYKNNKTKLLWECENDHRWFAILKDVKLKNTWCKKCSGNEKLTIEKMQELAIENDGYCLSTTYTNNKIPLLWKCKNNHIWKASPHSIKSGKHWCQKCHFENLKYTIDDMRKLANSHNGKCISNIYIMGFTVSFYGNVKKDINGKLCHII